MPVDFYQEDGCPGCLAVKLTINQLNIPVNYIHLDMEANEHLKPEFLKINPAHLIPTIVDDGFNLWESRAITRYLANQYAPDNELYPRDAKKRAKVDLMLDFDLGSLYASATQWMYPPVLQNVPPSPEKEQAMIEKLKLFDQLLSNGHYAAGDHLTIADFSLAASLHTINSAGHNVDQYPNIKSWLNRLENELPYYKRLVTTHINAVTDWFAPLRKHLK
ncbi:glutathione S-transferase 1: isoform D-like protein [Dinothrombium tinctorium]|uniref:Glutathione S-transferase 1: isoform D-like protein n=1 Tax=Dinothrombium tinctorium TaxID=1965070 RepID=A0A3S3QBI9_9ACAR|nr:glutathione S-transferase 1: isoform D-like protein [Dinothrombium tinctorium]